MAPLTENNVPYYEVKTCHFLNNPAPDYSIRLQDRGEISVYVSKKGVTITSGTSRIIHVGQDGKIHLSVDDGHGVLVGFPFLKKHPEFNDQYQLCVNS